MAGSGTLLVEAAWMAMKRAPGLGRHFAFERWPMFAGTPQGKWHRMLHEAEQAVVRDGLPMLLGRDWLPKPMAWMEESVHRAGLDGLVRVEHGDVRKLRLPPGPGHVVTNPPYAERLGKDLQILGLYRSLGEVIPTWEGWNVAILSGHPRFPSEIGLRDQKRIRMFNGAIPCGFHLYGNAAQ
jgi:23S rRNA G2445 N2-methylase RlmL